LRFGLNPQDNSDASQDLDGDGITNLNEYLQGSNPTITPTSYAGTVLVDNPVAYWRFEELTGTTALDTSSSGRDATYIGTVGLGQNGIANGTGYALNINSSGAGYVDGPILNGTTVTGFDAWFSTGSLATHRDIITLYNTNTDRTIVSHRTDGKIGVWNDNTGVVLSSDNIISSTTVHHIALWYESTVNTTYMMIDGIVQQNTYAGNLLNINNPKTYIGATRHNTTIFNRYLGQIDEVAIYDKSLTANQFSIHYTVSSGNQ